MTKLDHDHELAEAYRRGAEDMREAAAKACENSRNWRGWTLDKAPEDFAVRIVRDLPLPEPPK